MTENKIVGKLRTALSDAVDSECKVLYILAESRKLLESYPPDPAPFALKLYCHWALHVDLSIRGTTLPFLIQAEKYAASVLAGNNDTAHEFAMLEEFASLETFRRQFKQFLGSYDLPTGVCDEKVRWHEFLKHYTGVIEDGSLSCNAKTHPLKLIERIIINKGTEFIDSEEFYMPFGLAWSIVLIDGRKLVVEAKAGAKGFAYSIELR